MTTDTPEVQEAKTKPEVKKTRRPASRRSRGKKSANPGQPQDAGATAMENTEKTVANIDTQKVSMAPETPATQGPDTKTEANKPRRPASLRSRNKKPTSPGQPQDTGATAVENTEKTVTTTDTQKVSIVIETPGPQGSETKTEVKKRRRSSSRRSRGKKPASTTQPQDTPTAEAQSTDEPVATLDPLPEAASSTPADGPIKKTGRKRKRNSSKNKQAQSAPQLEIEPETTDEDDGKPRSIKLLINADEPEECRVALLENGKLESFHVETMSREQHKGNIYKGRIVSIETNLQAAFVDLGTGKNGFLPFNEIHPEYYRKEVSPDSHWKNHKIKEVLAEGQEVLVEVVKDVTGNKGSSLTTYLSLPGRYVVLMPGSDSHGISKKIDKEEERQKLREMLDACNIPEGVGYIIRTASDGITKTALTNDVRYQIKLWQDIKAKALSEPTPALLYKEQSIIDRFLRDHFSAEIEEILVDSQEAFDQVDSFLALLPSAQRKKTTARLHKGPRPLLNSYNIEEQIDQIFQPTVKLPSGGSIVINPTEALVSIDVNSGSTGRDKNFEDTIFLANMEAAEELARQLRLRDLGGLIVVDFIDMRPLGHIKEVEKKVKTSMKRDKAKVDFTRISKFGLMEISRQRMGAPIQTGNYQTCEYCQGHGLVRSVETQALAFLRQIQTGVTRKNVATVHCQLPMEVGQYLLNKKRADLAEMEKEYKVSIIVETDATLKPAQAKIEFIKV